jgi:hypothetical protein
MRSIRSVEARHHTGYSQDDANLNEWLVGSSVVSTLFALAIVGMAVFHLAGSAPQTSVASATITKPTATAQAAPR